MKDIKVHFKVDNDNLTDEEKVYNKVLIMCMSFEDSEIDCYPILPIYFEMLKLDNSEFRDLFISVIGNKNFILADIFFNHGVNINHVDIIDAFKELCFYNQIEIIQYLVDRGFQVTTKIKNEIRSEFETEFFPGFNKRDTIEYVEKIWFQNRIEKIYSLRNLILKNQTN
jgi:hypothetical protein